MGIFPCYPGVEVRVGVWTPSTTAPHKPTSGYYFATLNGVPCVCSARGGVERVTPQSSWNLDRLDGTGPSKIVLDLTKIQAIVIEYMGSGPGRMGFKIDGAVVYCNSISETNTSQINRLPQLSQPVTYGIWSQGGTAQSSMTICEVSQEGSSDSFGITGAADTDGTAISIAQGAHKMIMAARINPATPNFQVEMVDSYLFNPAANTTFQWFQLWNPTFSKTLTWITVPDSCIQVALGTVSPATVTAAGLQMKSGYNNSKVSSETTNASRSRLSLGMSITGVPDVIALTAKSLSGTCSMYGGFTAKQLL